MERTERRENNELARLKVQAANLQGSLLNLRQMLDQSNLHAQSAKQESIRAQQLLTAVVVHLGGVDVPASIMVSVLENNWRGINVDEGDDGLLIITPLPALEEEDEG